MMDPTLRSECSDEEAQRYIDHYLETINLLGISIARHKVLAKDAVTPGKRREYAATALELERERELVRNRREVFLLDQARIFPPSEEAVREAEARTKALAAMQAKEGNAMALLDITNKGLTAFNSLHPAPAAVVG